MDLSPRSHTTLAIRRRWLHATMIGDYKVTSDTCRECVCSGSDDRARKRATCQHGLPLTDDLAESLSQHLTVALRELAKRLDDEGLFERGEYRLDRGRL